MTISTTQQSIEVTDVGLVTISDVVENADNKFVREIRVFSDASGDSLVLTLRLLADLSNGVQLNAPAQTF